MDISIYKNRRENLLELLPENSVLLIPGAETQYRNSDSSFPFRQESNFYYLSGFCEPASLIAITKKDNKITSLIFVPPKDKLKEIEENIKRSFSFFCTFVYFNNFSH